MSIPVTLDAAGRDSHAYDGCALLDPASAKRTTKTLADFAAGRVSACPRCQLGLCRAADRLVTMAERPEDPSYVWVLVHSDATIGTWVADAVGAFGLELDPVARCGVMVAPYGTSSVLTFDEAVRAGTVGPSGSTAVCAQVHQVAAAATRVVEQMAVTLDAVGGPCSPRSILGAFLGSRHPVGLAAIVRELEVRVATDDVPTDAQLALVGAALGAWVGTAEDGAVPTGGVATDLVSATFTAAATFRGSAAGAADAIVALGGSRVGEPQEFIAVVSASLA